MASIRDIKRNARSARTPILAEQLRELFEYDPESGELFWKRRPAGTLNGHGYLQVQVLGQLILSHRLIFALVNGVFPEDEINHKNRDRSDNRWDNLKEVCRSHNMFNTGMLSNNTSGFKGVSKTKSGKWSAAITTADKKYHLGTFTTSEEANAAYLAARESILAGVLP